MITRAMLALLGILGSLVSLYFTLVYYGKMRADARGIPRICRLEESACQFLIRRPEAHIFNFPNFVVGLCFYLAVICLALMPEGAAPRFEWMLRFASGVAVAVGLYLSYTLIVRLRVNCTLCFASHFTNVCIFGFLLFRESV